MESRTSEKDQITSNCTRELHFLPKCAWLSESPMPGQSLIVIEAVIPKVIAFSILSGSQSPSLACLAGVSAVGLPAPLPWPGQSPLLLRQHRSHQPCCFYQMSSEGGELRVLARGEGASPGLIFRVRLCAEKMFYRCVKVMLSCG